MRQESTGELFEQRQENRCHRERDNVIQIRLGDARWILLFSSFPTQKKKARVSAMRVLRSEGKLKKQRQADFFLSPCQINWTLDESRDIFHQFVWAPPVHKLVLN
jgi:hypothetical protein